MLKMILNWCLCLVLLAAPTLEYDGEDPSPCPGVFVYDLVKTRPGRWYGVLNLSTDSTLHSLSLHIILENEALVLWNSIGNASSYDNKNFRIEAPEMEISPGPTVPVHIDVQHDTNKSFPRLLAITLNGKVICNILSTIKFSSGGSGYRDAFINYALRIITSTIRTNPIGIDGKPQCGKVVANATVLNGRSKLDTQWPWQIALYKRGNMGISYACGGTLITARNVITAAHCVINESTNRAVKLSTLSVFLGKHKLSASSDDVQIRYVSDIIVYPHFNASTYRYDAAILELDESVQYTDWIKPACLWPENDIDLKSVIGKNGLLLSWRFDDKDKVIDDLNQEEVPVVSQATCIKSHERMVRYTSEYTYCAGNRREISSCASAGSGMVFELGSTWYLRGLVGYNGKRCDTTQYVIFTDLAKLLPWINDNVYDY